MLVSSGNSSLSLNVNSPRAERNFDLVTDPFQGSTPTTPSSPAMLIDTPSSKNSPYINSADSKSTWPTNTSYSMSIKPRGQRPGPTIVHYEVALVERLAQALIGESCVLDSIEEVSGVICTKVMSDSGMLKLVAEGTSSAVTKAKQLIDAKLSQMAARLLIAVQFSTIVPGHLSLEKVKVPHFGPKSKRLAGKTFFRFTERSALEANTNDEAPLPSSFSGSSYDTASSPPFFTHNSRSTSYASLIDEKPEGILPDISDFASHKQAYVESIVDECEIAVRSRSLARCRVYLGKQYFYTDATEIFQDQKWSVEEVEKWKLDGAHRDLSSYFCVSLSRSSVERIRRKLVERFGFRLILETSRVRIQHLDRFRAVYAVATCDLRGGEIRNVEPNAGITGNGTLVLVKCSTLPCKPFALSVVRPASAIGEAVTEATDLHVKILADKAATSPSQALSQALNHASWDLDMNGVFSVHIKLDEQRFLPSQTEVRWMAKSRYETERLRATICEVRQDGTSQHWYEIEVSSKPLNGKLAAVTHQGKTNLDRENTAKLAQELLTFCHELSTSLKNDGESE